MSCAARSSNAFPRSVTPTASRSSHAKSSTLTGLLVTQEAPVENFKVRIISCAFGLFSAADTISGMVDWMAWFTVPIFSPYMEPEQSTIQKK